MPLTPEKIEHYRLSIGGFLRCAADYYRAKKIERSAFEECVVMAETLYGVLSAIAFLTMLERGIKQAAEVGVNVDVVKSIPGSIEANVYYLHSLQQELYALAQKYNIDPDQRPKDPVPEPTREEGAVEFLAPGPLPARLQTPANKSPFVADMPEFLKKFAN